ncbi:MAG: EF-P lysine aminoacylase GenX [Deltaproteobacteria bacterium]|nr:EF-P lysine aminoacylase GenX [Deltaproteobacteria bacterium]
MADEQIPARRNHTLRMRAGIIQGIREFFIERDYLEVETPLRIPAPAPESHIDAVPSDGWFLHTSPELCMKRLLAAGYSKIFQISKCFRDRERGSLHLPEFTLLEWYRAGIDYREMMNECEELMLFIAHSLDRGDTIRYQGTTIDVKKPWIRLSVKDAFDQYAPLSLEKTLENDCFDEIMVDHIEPRLPQGKPVFLYDYPISLASLARPKKSDPSVAERFEIYMGGLELANAFSELTDGEEQRARFSKELDYRRQQGKAMYPSPEHFLDALHNMPDSAGIALGVDRLVMIFSDNDTIDNVVTFTPEEL